MLTPTSYKAAGTLRSSSRGSASMLAAAAVARSVVNHSPAQSAATSPPVVTGPPMATPAVHCGSGIVGTVNSTRPALVASPKTSPNAIRMATVATPIRRKATKSVRVAAETFPYRRAKATVAVSATSSSTCSTGFEVREAAIATPAAHVHATTGWIEAGRTVLSCGSGARAGIRRRPVRARRSRR